MPAVFGYQPPGAPQEHHMKRRHVPLTAWLAIVGSLLTLALGGALATGHYLGAVWDSPLERLLAGLAATLDLRSPTIVLAALALALGVLLSATAVRRVRIQDSGTLDSIALEDEDLPPLVAEPSAPAAIRTILVNCDLENESVHEDEVPAFVRGFNRYYSGSTVEGHVYCESSLKPQSIRALVDQQFEEHDTPHRGQKQVADRAMIRGILMRLGRGLASGEQFRVVLVSHDTDFIPLIQVLAAIKMPVTVFVRSFTKQNGPLRQKFHNAGADVQRFDRFL
jgi:hypothetical protein